MAEHNRKRKIFIALTVILLLLGGGCRPEKPDFSLVFEKYALANGLEVILHQDHSDPIVAVSILYHVGSSREKPGKTGLAHLFEHIMFQQSQHVPPDQFVHKIQADTPIM